MRILVTGSRDWADRNVIGEALITARDTWWWRSPGPVKMRLVDGACPTGADAIAHELAKGWGWETERYPADWTSLGKRAGPLRNEHMVNLGADLVLAFFKPCSKVDCRGGPELHWSHGTVHCANLAHDAGLTTWRFYDHG